MISNHDARKDHLEKRWKEANDALDQLANLHIWPVGKDIAEVEGELLEQLDEIEYETGQDLSPKLP